MNKQKSINVVSVLTLIPSNFSPISLLLGPPYSLRPADIPTMISCSTERKNHTYLTSNKQLEMSQLTEEGVIEVKTGLKIGLLYQINRF